MLTEGLAWLYITAHGGAVQLQCCGEAPHRMRALVLQWQQLPEARLDDGRAPPAAGVRAEQGTAAPRPPCGREALEALDVAPW
jgi:hypothetical protein